MGSNSLDGLEIIVTDPAIMGGTPTIRGTRITADSIRGRVDDGDSINDILADYPYLDQRTIEAAVRYAREHPQTYRPTGTLCRKAP